MAGVNVAIPVATLPPLFSQLPPISVKLNDGNFLMWQQQVDVAVYGYGLEGFLTGESNPPEQLIADQDGSMVLNPAFVSWQRQDRRVAGWLLSSLSENALTLVVGLRSARSIWEALETNFASRSTAKVMQYRQQMQTLKKDGLTMTEFLGKMRTYFDLLGSVGCKVSEGEQVLHILGGLGQEYDPAVCAVTSRSDPWNIADVSAFLLSFESRMESTRAHFTNSDGSQPTLNLMQQQATQRRDQQSSSYSNNRYEQTGGRGSGGRSQRGGRGGRGFGRGSGKIICQLCEKPGHSAAKCWHRFEQNFTPPQLQLRGNAQQQGFNTFNPSAHLVHSVPRSPSSSYSIGTPSEFNYGASASTCWYPDSGATHHVSNDLSNLNISSDYTGGKDLLLGNGSAVSIANIGESAFKSHSTSFSRILHLKNLLHVPNITKNLMSVSQFAQDNSVFFEFHPKFCFVKDLSTREIVLKGTLDKGLYRFLVDHTKIKRGSVSISPSSSDIPAVHSLSLANSKSSSSSSSVPSLDLSLWHNRLGHPTLDVVKLALNSCNIPYSSMKNSSLCHSCCVSKAHRLPYTSSTSMYTAPLELVHSDLWGPSPIKSRNGYSYYVSFIDHFSRFTWIFLLKNKSDVGSVFRQFKAMAENLIGTRIKMLQSDWGGEYQGLASFLRENGIIHRVSCPYTPQQNGLAERKHRHVVETGLALLAQSSLPGRFWDDAFLTAVHLINLMPSKIIDNISPHEKLLLQKPNYTTLKVFGCLCFPFTRPYNKHKLHFRSVKGTFLGYSHNHKGYKVLLPDGKLIITRDVVFDECVFPFHNLPVADSTQQNTPISSSDLSAFLLPLMHPIPTSESLLSSASENVPNSGNSLGPTFSDSDLDASHNPPSPVQSFSDAAPVPPIITSTHPMTTRSKSGIFRPKAFTVSISTSLVPKSASEALLIPSWKAAMLSEFNALLLNKTWTLTTLPQGKNLVGCTWVYKIKLHSSGAVARHKARLVAQGFSQQPGFDFNETFSPVVKPTTIRIILSLAVSLDWTVTHLDVNNAFLNGELKEDIYMKQPPGFEQGGPHLVCKLNKAIYGLKQASRAWFFTVHSVLLTLGFSQSKADASMFFRQQENDVIYLLIYVDDMLITGNSSVSIRTVISQLNSSFSLKDLGEVSLFLGVEVTKTDDGGLHLCQSNYVKDLLKKANMEGAKGCPTPMVSSSELSKHSGELVSDSRLYRSIVGALQYASITRPDICFAVNKVSQYMAEPLDTHWRAVKRILRYLSGTLDYGIQIRKSKGDISAFSDSDWAADLDDRRSTTGICAYHGRNLISWCVKKQTVVARSSTEAEYRSLAQAAAEVAWLTSLLDELKVKKELCPVIWVDNMSAIALASNPVLHARTKHIELDIHFVRDKVLNQEIELRHVPTGDQIADIFTKPLSHQPFVKLRERLNVISLASLGLRGRVRDQGGSTIANNATLSSVEGHCVEAVSGARKKAVDNSTQAEHVAVPDITAKMEDHFSTWRDVVIKGMKKKDVLQDSVILV